MEETPQRMGRICIRKDQLGLLTLLWLLNSVCKGAVTRAQLGEDAVLNCRFETARSEGLILEWTLRDPVRLAYSFHGGEARAGRLDQQFRGRTGVEVSGLSRGEASMTLRETRVQDGGQYLCFVRTNGGKQETWAGLELAAPYSEPHVSCSLVEPSSQPLRVNLSCRSGGGFPQSEASWQWANGTLFPGESRWWRAGDGTFDLRSWVTVEAGLEPGVRCAVRDWRLNRTLVSRRSCEGALTGDVGGGRSNRSRCVHPCRGNRGSGQESRQRFGLIGTALLILLLAVLLPFHARRVRLQERPQTCPSSRSL